jgi:hypothetical protein
MPTLVPNRFLVRVCHPCPYVKGMPREHSDRLLDLPESGRPHALAALDGRADFADLRLGWNELGLGVQVTVTGKSQPPAGDSDRPRTSDGLTLWIDTRDARASHRASRYCHQFHFLPAGDSDRPRTSDGLTLWIDTRDARASHRASRYCHQFHFLPAGGGPDKDQPAFSQSKINRALQDAPLCSPADVAFRCERLKNGYRLEAFLPAAVLTGFDPEQHPRLGLFYHLRDAELGDQFLSVGHEFPFTDDPSLWEPLELVKAK